MNTEETFGISVNELRKHSLSGFSYLAISAFSLVGVYFAYYSILVEDLSILFSYLFLAFIGVRLSNKKHRFSVFILHYSVYSLFAVVFYYYFISINAKPFIGGGDDELFYTYSGAFFKSNFDFNLIHNGVPFVAVGYRAYIFILSGYFWLINSIGFESTDIYHLILLNVFIGGLTANYIFKLAVKLRIRDLRWVFLASLFPVTIFHHVTLLRDSWLFLFFLVIADMLFSQKRLSTRQWLFAIVLVIISANFRLAHGAIFAFLLGLNVLYRMKKRSHQILLISAVLLVVFGFLNSFIYEQIDRVSRVSEFYSSETVQNANSGSLGALFFESKNPALLLIRPFFVLYQPIPPMIFTGVNLQNFFLSIGNIAWYFILTAYFVGFRCVSQFDLKRKKIQIITFLMLLFSMLLVSFTSRDSRHLLFLYPMVNLVALLYIQKYPKLFKSVIAAILMGSFFLISIYVFLKAIL